MAVLGSEPDGDRQHQDRFSGGAMGHNEIRRERVDLTLVLDRTMLEKVAGYFIYRSAEMEEGRPIVDGLYMQRQVVGSPPPATMRITIDWT